MSCPHTVRKSGAPLVIAAPLTPALSPAERGEGDWWLLLWPSGTDQLFVYGRDSDYDSVYVDVHVHVHESIQTFVGIRQR